MKVDPKTIRFEEIMEEIQQLADEAVELLPRNSSMEARARCYWFAYLHNVVDNHGCMVTMQETLEELKEHVTLEKSNKIFEE